jgi:hypothetical protein
MHRRRVLNKNKSTLKDRIRAFVNRNSTQFDLPPRKTLREQLDELDFEGQSRELRKTRVKVGVDGKYIIPPPPPEPPQPRRASSRPPPKLRSSVSMRKRLELSLEDTKRRVHQRAQREDMIQLAKALNSAYEDVHNEKPKKEN